MMRLLRVERNWKGCLKVESEMSKVESISCPAQDLKVRTQQFALRVIRLVRKLPRNTEAFIIGKQLLRSATSVGANYRSCQRGKSKADFIAKLAIAEEEADESCYWLELIIAAGLLPEDKVIPLLQEAQEITAILTASGRTAKKNRI